MRIAFTLLLVLTGDESAGRLVAGRGGIASAVGWAGPSRVYQNTLKFEIQGVHHFSTQEMVPIEATKSFRALSLS